MFRTFEKVLVMRSLGLLADCEQVSIEKSLAINKKETDNIVEETNIDLPKSAYYNNYNGSVNKWMLEYDCLSKNPKWGFELLLKETSNNSKTIANRKNSKFFADPNIDDNFKIYHKDYLNSGFDRGHMIPAGDFMETQEALDSTFVMTNMTPQNPSLNKGFWAKLETYIRLLVLKEEYDEVAVVTGPVYAPVYVNGRWLKSHSTIGTFPKLITVPSHFFKVILAKRYLPTSTANLDYQQVVVAAFLIPNADSVSNEASLGEYLVKVNELETIVGMKFFVKGLSDTSRAKVDKFVPSDRSLEIVLKHVVDSSNTHTLISVQSSSTDPSSKSIMSTGNSISTDTGSGSGTGSAKSRSGRSVSSIMSGTGSGSSNVLLSAAGVYHLCQTIDCSTSLSSLLNHHNRENSNSNSRS